MAISDRRLLGSAADIASWTAWLDRLADLGVDAVQIREKDLDDVALFELACALVAHCARQPAARPTRRLMILVNGRADLAAAAGARGVHLPADGLPTASVRAAFPGLLIGRSTHSIDEIEAETDADYVTFGPFAATPSKAGLGEPVGIEGLRAAVRCERPVLALGGIDARNAPAALGTRVHGLAAIRAFADPVEAAALVTLSTSARSAACDLEASRGARRDRFPGGPS